MGLIFVTGPVRSGKSSFAARMAHESGLAVTYVATAARDETDPEWRARLEHHAAIRDPNWQLVETESMTEHALQRLFTQSGKEQCLLVDSLGGWLSQRIFDRAARLESDFVATLADLDDRAAEFASLLLSSSAHVIVVSEQTGWGIVPYARSARAFRDVLGRMDQRLARSAAAAYLVVAGYAVDLRKVGTPVIVSS